MPEYKPAYTEVLFSFKNKLFIELTMAHASCLSSSAATDSYSNRVSR